MSIQASATSSRYRYFDIELTVYTDTDDTRRPHPVRPRPSPQQARPVSRQHPNPRPSHVDDRFSIDPLSLNTIQNPWIALPCGHSFDKSSLDDLFRHARRQGRAPVCPLDNVTVIRQIVPNRLANEALVKISELQAKVAQLEAQNLQYRKDIADLQNRHLALAQTSQPASQPIREAAPTEDYRTLAARLDSIQKRYDTKLKHAREKQKEAEKRLAQRPSCDCSIKKALEYHTAELMKQRLNRLQNTNLVDRVRHPSTGTLTSVV